MTIAARDQKLEAPVWQDLDRGAPGPRSSRPLLRQHGWLLRRLLVAADLAGLVLAFVATEFAFRASGHNDMVAAPLEILLFTATLPLWPLLARLYGLYDRDDERVNHVSLDDFGGVFHLVTVGIWLIFAATWLSGLAHPQLPRIFLFWLLAIALITALRSSARTFCRSRIDSRQVAVILGAGSSPT